MKLIAYILFLAFLLSPLMAFSQECSLIFQELIHEYGGDDRSKKFFLDQRLKRKRNYMKKKRLLFEPKNLLAEAFAGFDLGGSSVIKAVKIKGKMYIPATKIFSLFITSNDDGNYNEYFFQLNSKKRLVDIGSTFSCMDCGLFKLRGSFSFLSTLGKKIICNLTEEGAEDEE